jgi:hypothetical protein
VEEHSSRVRKFSTVTWTHAESCAGDLPTHSFGFVGNFSLRSLEFGKCAMAELYPSLVQCAIVAAAFKVLLFPA